MRHAMYSNSSPYCKFRFGPILILVSFLLPVLELEAQVVRLCEEGSKIPIPNAMLIQQNKLIAVSDEDGYIKIKSWDTKSSACIKALGFVDTCFVLENNASAIHLKPLSIMTSEVIISDEAIDPEELFVKFLETSLRLSNQKDEIRSYRFNLILKPDSSENIDQLEGVFSYREEAATKKSRYNALYACWSRHTVSRELSTDSIMLESMLKGNNLPVVIWDLIPLKKRTVKWYKNSLQTKSIHMIISESDYIFTYVDSTYFPFKSTWKFDSNGRLLEYECISKREEDKEFPMQGNRYCYQLYTRNGILMPKSATILQTFQKDVELPFRSEITLELDVSNCYKNTDTNFFIGMSISNWAKRFNIPTTIIDN